MERVFIGDIEVHPAAALFPEMSPAEVHALYEDIRERGVQNPIVFHEGKLLDGRNRARACIVAGIASKNIPRINLGGDVDPYRFAWAQNCERLDYSPSLKADIKRRITQESGEYERLQREARERANMARAEKAKEQHAISNPRKGEKVSGGASRDAPPDGGEKRRTNPDNKAAAKMAKAAGVSTSTMERAIARSRRGAAPEKDMALRGTGMVTKWSVPRDIAGMSAFLRERLTSADRLRLARSLSDGGTPPHDVRAEARFILHSFTASERDRLVAILAAAEPMSGEEPAA